MGVQNPKVWSYLCNYHRYAYIVNFDQILKYDPNLATLLKDLANLVVLEVRKCFHWIPRLRKCWFSYQNRVSRSIRSKVITKFSNMTQIWQPCLKIWQPCLFQRFENASIGFLALENVGLAYKIMFLAQLEAKLQSIKCFCRGELGLVG